MNILRETVFFRFPIVDVSQHTKNLYVLYIIIYKTLQDTISVYK